MQSLKMVIEPEIHLYSYQLQIFYMKVRNIRVFCTLKIKLAIGPCKSLRNFWEEIISIFTRSGCCQEFNPKTTVDNSRLLPLHSVCFNVSFMENESFSKKHFLENYLIYLYFAATLKISLIKFFGEIRVVF